TNEDYIVGAPLPASFIGLDDAGSIPLTVQRNGVPLYDGPAKHANGDPLAPLVGYANAGGFMTEGLKRGQIVTTGTLSPLLPVEGLDEISVRLADKSLDFKVSRRV